MILNKLVEWWGDIFAPLAGGGPLVFDSDPNQISQNDVDGVEAVLYVAGSVSLVLYAALLISGYWSVFCNDLVSQAIEHVDSAG